MDKTPRTEEMLSVPGDKSHNPSSDVDELLKHKTHLTRVVGNKTLTYVLNVAQEPDRARACGSGIKLATDRHPVDPPPVVVLSILERRGDQQVDITSSYIGTFFMHATLEADTSTVPVRSYTKATHNRGTSEIAVLAGCPVTTGTYLDRPIQAIYFVFSDLSVKNEGNFKFSFNLYERCLEDSNTTLYDVDMKSSERADYKNAASPQDDFIWRIELNSAVFTVFNAKDFPGISESTTLTKTLSEQGVQVKTRRDTRMGRRGSKSLDDFSSPRIEDPTTDEPLENYTDDVVRNDSTCASPKRSNYFGNTSKNRLISPVSKSFTQAGSIHSSTPRIKMEDHPDFVGHDTMMMSTPQLSHSIMVSSASPYARSLDATFYDQPPMRWPKMEYGNPLDLPGISSLPIPHYERRSESPERGTSGSQAQRHPAFDQNLFSRSKRSPIETKNSLHFRSHGEEMGQRLLSSGMNFKIFTGKYSTLIANKGEELRKVQDIGTDQNREGATMRSACVQCRSKHLKCDGLNPCSRCSSNSFECVYVRSRRGFKGPRRNDVVSKMTATSSLGQLEESLRELQSRLSTQKIPEKRSLGLLDSRGLKEQRQGAAGMTLIFKSKDLPDFELAVELSTKVEIMLDAFRRGNDIPDNTTITLYHDGEELELSDTVQSMVMGNMDVVEVHIR
ncbi:uncharacterized protein LY89DRAFT_1899 [Mollisia scopiformis]|uniref:Zn(2)-C6 fungal-type domain-containing protein n=1 Tax=Mollisia scopiformis TaxID=149040 RepID=A0A194XVL9_MOLSC|nr:uncharacterized protein LY89DRAFT_1899 [Mollisia scopiformis]KUJ23752.1 hypothetical protein LY89DRAFT_1899 [Mollisia scopiformis]